MAAIVAYRVGAVEIGATAIDVNRSNLDLGAIIASQNTAASLTPQYQAINEINPGGNFSSFQVKAVLDALGATFSKDISGLTGGVELFAGSFEQGCGLYSTSVHRKLSIQDGIISAVSITANGTDDAEIECNLLVTHDGSNEMVVETDDNALPSVSDNIRFALGTVKFGDITIGQLQNLTINFGITPTALRDASEVRRTFPHITSVAPTVTLTVTDITEFAAASIPFAGKAMTHANTTMYLRKRTIQSASFVSDVTEEHIKFTAYGLAAADNILSADPSSATMSLTATLGDDGTNEALVVDTTSAIT